MYTSHLPIPTRRFGAESLSASTSRAPPPPAPSQLPAASSAPFNRLLSRAQSNSDSELLDMSLPTGQCDQSRLDFDQMLGGGESLLIDGEAPSFLADTTLQSPVKRSQTTRKGKERVILPVLEENDDWMTVPLLRSATDHDSGETTSPISCAALPPVSPASKASPSSRPEIASNIQQGERQQVNVDVPFQDSADSLPETTQSEYQAPDVPPPSFPSPSAAPLAAKESIDTAGLPPVFGEEDLHQRTRRNVASADRFDIESSAVSIPNSLDNAFAQFSGDSRETSGFSQSAPNPTSLLPAESVAILSAECHQSRSTSLSEQSATEVVLATTSAADESAGTPAFSFSIDAKTSAPSSASSIAPPPPSIALSQSTKCRASLAWPLPAVSQVAVPPPISTTTPPEPVVAPPPSNVVEKSATLPLAIPAHILPKHHPAHRRPSLARKLSDKTPSIPEKEESSPMVIKKVSGSGGVSEGQRNEQPTRLRTGLADRSIEAPSLRSSAGRALTSTSQRRISSTREEFGGRTASLPSTTQPDPPATIPLKSSLRASNSHLRSVSPVPEEPATPQPTPRSAFPSQALLAPPAFSPILMTSPRSPASARERWPTHGMMQSTPRHDLRVAFSLPDLSGEISQVDVDALYAVVEEEEEVEAEGTASKGELKEAETVKIVVAEPVVEPPPAPPSRARRASIVPKALATAVEALASRPAARRASIHPPREPPLGRPTVPSSNPEEEMPPPALPSRARRASHLAPIDPIEFFGNAPLPAQHRRKSVAMKNVESAPVTEMRPIDETSVEALHEPEAEQAAVLPVPASPSPPLATAHRDEEVANQPTLRPTSIAGSASLDCLPPPRPPRVDAVIAPPTFISEARLSVVPANPSGRSKRPKPSSEPDKAPVQKKKKAGPPAAIGGLTVPRDYVSHGEERENERKKRIEQREKERIEKEAWEKERAREKDATRKRKAVVEQKGAEKRPKLVPSLPAGNEKEKARGPRSRPSRRPSVPLTREALEASMSLDGPKLDLERRVSTYLLSVVHGPPEGEDETPFSGATDTPVRAAPKKSAVAAFAAFVGSAEPRQVAPKSRALEVAKSQRVAPSQTKAGTKSTSRPVLTVRNTQNQKPTQASRSSTSKTSLKTGTFTTTAPLKPSRPIPFTFSVPHKRSASTSTATEKPTAMFTERLSSWQARDELSFSAAESTGVAPAPVANAVVPPAEAGGRKRARPVTGGVEAKGDAEGGKESWAERQKRREMENRRVKEERRKQEEEEERNKLLQLRASLGVVRANPVPAFIRGGAR